MDGKMIIAVPTEMPGGLEAIISGHFGHCGVFTLVAMEDGKVGDVTLLDNAHHVQGGCMTPVNLLADNKVDILIAGGMGMRPLQGFNSVGIDVYHNNGLQRVDQVVAAMADGKLPQFGAENTCGGGEQ